jgi:hypothetical protein
MFVDENWRDREINTAGAENQRPLIDSTDRRPGCRLYNIGAETRAIVVNHSPLSYNFWGVDSPSKCARAESIRRKAGSIERGCIGRSDLMPCQSNNEAAARRIPSPSEVICHQRITASFTVRLEQRRRRPEEKASAQIDSTKQSEITLLECHNQGKPSCLKAARAFRAMERCKICVGFVSSPSLMFG